MKLLLSVLLVILVGCTEEPLRVTPEDLALVSKHCDNNDGVLYYDIYSFYNYRISMPYNITSYKINIDQLGSVMCKNGAFFSTPSSMISK